MYNDMKNVYSLELFEKEKNLPASREILGDLWQQEGTVKLIKSMYLGKAFGETLLDEEET